MRTKTSMVDPADRSDESQNKPPAAVSPQAAQSALPSEPQNAGTTAPSGELQALQNLDGQLTNQALKKILQ